MKFILVCSCGPLEGFRGAELDSIAQLYNFSISYSEVEYEDPSRPYIIVELESEVEARLLGERSISVKQIYSYWAHATNYEDLHASLQQRKEIYVRQHSLSHQLDPLDRILISFLATIRRRYALEIRTR